MINPSYAQANLNKMNQLSQGLRPCDFPVEYGGLISSPNGETASERTWITYEEIKASDRDGTILKFPGQIFRYQLHNLRKESLSFELAQDNVFCFQSLFHNLDDLVIYIYGLNALE